MKTPLPALLALVLAGCLDSTQDYVLNPDGSGKVAVKMVFSKIEIGPEKPAAEALADAARDEVEKAEGVDAWTNVSFKTLPDGKSEFLGTAYFKDFSRLKLHHQGFKGPIEHATLTRDASGASTLEFKPEKKDGDGAAPADLSAEQLQSRMKEERAKWQQMKPLMAGMLGEMKSRKTFKVPGKLTASSNFKREGDGQFGVAIEGAALLKAVDGLISDDARFAAMLKSGGDLQNSPPPAEELFGLILGEKAPLKATWAGGGKPLFDYAAELKAAKAGEPALRKTLGLGPAAQAAPAEGGGIKGARVLGVKHVYATDDKRGIRPLNSMSTGMTLSVIVELPGAALGVKEGKLLRATGDAGEDLLPKREWDRRLSFPQLTEDRTGIVFDVTLKSPATSKGLAEVAGSLVYQVGGKTKDVDLGLGAWTAGAKGKEMGAEIEDFNEQAFDKTTVLALKFAAPRETIADVEFFDEAGKKLDAKASGSMSMGRSTTLHYALKGKWPAKGKIVAKVYDDLKSFEAAFSLKDLDLLGRPAK